MNFVAPMIKRAFWVVIICLALISFPQPCSAVTVKEVPNPRQVYGGWVTDMADLLDAETQGTLNRIISQLEAKNGTEIAVVTVPDTSPAPSPKNFATRLFNHWGIGKKGKNNGVLFLISQQERRVEIETGYGIEKILSNARISVIIYRYIIPWFKQGDFKGGILAGTEALVNALERSNFVSVTNPAQLYTQIEFNPHLLLLPLLAGGLIIGIPAIIFVILKYFVPTFIEPEGRSEIFNSESIFSSQGNGSVHCVNCKQRMEKLDSTSLLSYLRPPEQVSQNVGSTRFEGWHCSNCHPYLTRQGLHLRAYVLKPDCFSHCPNCQEFIVKRQSQILTDATESSVGERLVIEKCMYCSYVKERVEEIPRLSSYSSDGSYSDGGGSSWSGGSDFGGGDSGGGGDGGSW